MACSLRGGEGKVDEAQVAGPGVREKEKINLTDYKKKSINCFPERNGQERACCGQYKGKARQSLQGKP